MQEIDMKERCLQGFCAKATKEHMWPSKSKAEEGSK